MFSLINEYESSNFYHLSCYFVICSTILQSTVFDLKCRGYSEGCTKAYER